MKTLVMLTLVKSKHLFTSLLLLACTMTQAQEFDWVKGIGSVEDDYAPSITLDNDHNLLVTGYFKDSVDFDLSEEGIAYLSAEGIEGTLFIAKYDSLGNYQWAFKLFSLFSNGEVGEVVKVNSIAIDEANNIYIGGSFRGFVDFDPTESTSSFVANNRDSFIAKYDPDGNYLWTTQFSHFSYIDEISCLEVGNTGLCFARKINEKFNIGKVDFEGNTLWLHSIGEVVCAGQTIAVDDEDNMYVSGYFNTDLDFDPSEDEAILDAEGLYSLFMAKYDINGNYLWAKNIVSNADGDSHSLLLDNNNNLIITGRFSGAADFDPSDSVMEFIANDYDVFLGKYNSEGNLIWAHGFGGAGSDAGRSLAIDGEGSIYLAGDFDEGPVDFDPSISTTELPGEGGFLTKYSGAGHLLWAKKFEGSFGIYYYNREQIMALDSDKSIYLTGVLDNTVDFSFSESLDTLSSNGESDIFFVKYNDCPPTYSELSVTTCNSYVSPSGDYRNESAIFNDVISNSSGCDSIITIDLHINESTNTNLDITACGSYYWSATNDTIYSSGEYFALLTTEAGCDSTIDLDLTITSAVTSIEQNTNVLTANAWGAAYQWLDCDSDFEEIEGATGGLFVANDPGNYAVEVTQNGCVDTSACYQITEISVDDIKMPQLELYPNPVIDMLNIKMGLGEELPIRFSIYNAVGEEIRSIELNDVNTSHDLSDLPSGTYWIRLEAGDEVGIRKIIKMN